MTETFFTFTFPHIGSISLSLSNIIEITGIIIAFVTSIAAIIISVISLRQNSKMIEESSRAVIGIYTDSINPGEPFLYLIVKNFGNSQAVITKFNYDFDFMNCYGIDPKRDYLKDFVNCSIAPKQTRTCYLDFSKLSRPVKFDVEYISCGKTYSDSFTIDLKTGTSMPARKFATKGKELQSISYSLQDMLTKNL